MSSRKYIESPSSVIRSTHFDGLMRAYDEVGCTTWNTEDFLQINLDVSRSLFTSDSLKSRRPLPRELEVVALLSGISFDREFTHELFRIQRKISELIGDRLHYWVEQENLGVEYCVFKWPSDTWNDEKLFKVKSVLSSMDQPSFRYSISGIQINPDGCVVAKGIDQGAGVFKIREHLKNEVPFIPEKQSGWAHVPLGRILEPVGVERFAKLKDLIAGLSDITVATTEIHDLKLVHESRWYMVEKEILEKYPLSSVTNEAQS